MSLTPLVATGIRAMSNVPEVTSAAAWVWADATLLSAVVSPVTEACGMFVSVFSAPSIVRPVRANRTSSGSQPPKFPGNADDILLEIYYL